MQHKFSCFLFVVLLFASVSTRLVYAQNPVADLQAAADPFDPIRKLQKKVGPDSSLIVPAKDLVGFTAVTIGASNMLPDKPRIGQEKVVTALAASCNANWSGVCDRGKCQDNLVYTAPAGWVLMDFNHRPTVNNNGGYSVSQIAGGTNFVLEKTLDDTYNSEIEAAIKDKDKSYEAKVRELYELHKKARIWAQTNTGAISASISAEAHGSCVDRRGGSIGIEVYAKLVYIGSEADIKRAVHQSLQ